MLRRECHTGMAGDPTTVSEVVITAAPKSNLVRPRARMLVNGTEIIPTSCTVNRNNNFQADTFEADFALWETADRGLDFWFNTEDMEVEIQSGYLKQGTVDWNSVFKGKVDTIAGDLTGGSVKLSGRDKTGQFIDTKTFLAFPNKKASEIVTQLAGTHGLKAEVTATTTNVGVFYKGDHVHIAGGEFGQSRTEWDLITYLARKEGYDAWVFGDTIFFHPADDDNAETRSIDWTPPTIKGNLSKAYDSNVIDLKVTHNLALAKDIKVVVRSWHTKLGKKTEQTSTRTRATKKPLPGKNYTAGGGGNKKKDGQTFYFTIPNLTPEEAQERANQLYDEIVKHEYTLEWSMPGDLNFTPRTKVQIVSDTDIGILDQTYYVESATIEFGFGVPFVVKLRAKNHPEPGEGGEAGSE